MGADFTVAIKNSNFTGIRSLTNGGVIYAGNEPSQGLQIQTTGNTAASISEFTITDSIFYDFIDLAVINPLCTCDCMKNYERYGYLFYVDQEPALVFTITNTIIDNFSNKSVNLSTSLSLNQNLIYPEDDNCYTE
jgi:predicted outer membrane repeat protein